MKKMFIVTAMLLGSASINSSLFAMDCCGGTVCTADISQKKTVVQGKFIYTCPMHPEVKSDKPGKCPKCGMTLEKKAVTPPVKSDKIVADKKIQKK
jgi:hypothetical protein